MNITYKDKKGIILLFQDNNLCYPLENLNINEAKMYNNWVAEQQRQEAQESFHSHQIADLNETRKDEKQESKIEIAALQKRVAELLAENLALKLALKQQKDEAIVDQKNDNNNLATGETRPAYGQFVQNSHSTLPQEAAMQTTTDESANLSLSQLNPPPQAEQNETVNICRLS